MKTKSNCIACGKVLDGRKQKYCSKTCKNKILQSYDSQKRRGLRRKIELIESLGGRCSLCGYSRNLAGLTFHHSELTKEFKLDMRSLSNRTYESVIREVKKCSLLCHNCHAEIHNPNLNLDLLIK